MKLIPTRVSYTVSYFREAETILMNASPPKFCTLFSRLCTRFSAKTRDQRSLEALPSLHPNYPLSEVYCRDRPDGWAHLDRLSHSSSSEYFVASVCSEPQNCLTTSTARRPPSIGKLAFESAAEGSGPVHDFGSELRSKCLRFSHEFPDRLLSTRLVDSDDDTLDILELHKPKHAKPLNSPVSSPVRSSPYPILRRRKGSHFKEKGMFTS